MNWRHCVFADTQPNTILQKYDTYTAGVLEKMLFDAPDLCKKKNIKHGL